jgi:predicted ATPase
MVCLFIVSWLPYALISQFGILGLSDLVTPYSAEIPVLLAKTSAVWNPIVYAVTGWSKIYQHHERRRRRYMTCGGASMCDRQARATLAGPMLEMNPMPAASATDTSQCGGGSVRSP